MTKKESNYLVLPNPWDSQYSKTPARENPPNTAGEQGRSTLPWWTYMEGRRMGRGENFLVKEIQKPAWQNED